VLRIHFTPEDLSRTRLTPKADLQWETALSLNLLQSAESTRALTSWRTWARRRLGTWAAPLLAAAPLAEHFPDFRSLLEKEQYADLNSTLERYHAEVIEPTWPAISAAVSMDRTRRTRSLLENGLEGLLGTLTPMFRWRAPVLELDRPLVHDLHLDGRGLVLVPSYFCSRRPIVVARPGQPAVLIHPIGPEARVLIKTERIQDRRPQGIDALMGSTRAAVLQALSDGCTTTELAERVGVSTASASEHATILREAGLISTQRRGPSVLHMVTELGSAVLNTN
jgi:DNA-binding transcriptional ArsR family regulator